MPADDRDKQFERALARHLRHVPHAEACPDAEILAAYHEHTLSLQEAAHWKQHIAACSLCQEVLSLMEETDAVPVREWEERDAPVFAEALNAAIPLRAPAGRGFAQEEPSLPAAAAVTAAPTKVLLRRMSWRWAAPLGALAAGLLVWVGLHETRMAQKSGEVEIAQNRQASPPPSPSALSGTPAQLERFESSSRTPEPTLGLESETPSPKARRVTPPLSSSPKLAAAPRVRTDQSVERDKLVASEQKKEQASDAAKFAPIPRPPGASADVSAAGQLDLAPPPLPSAGTGTGDALGGNLSEIARAKNSQQSTSQSIEVSGAAAAPTVAGTRPQLEMSHRSKFSAVNNPRSEGVTIIVADEKHIWRVGAAGKIELTSDGGKTWERQVSPLAADLTAGSAPSEKVCWIVGKAGTVLLTTDAGKHWTKLAAPMQDDLGGVRAVDASQATIWNLPNQRSFVTSDGGATWTQTADR